MKNKYEITSIEDFEKEVNIELLNICLWIDKQKERANVINKNKYDLLKYYNNQRENYDSKIESLDYYIAVDINFKEFPDLENLGLLDIEKRFKISPEHKEQYLDIVSDVLQVPYSNLSKKTIKLLSISDDEILNAKKRAGEHKIYFIELILDSIMYSCKIEYCNYMIHITQKEINHKDSETESEKIIIEDEYKHPNIFRKHGYNLFTRIDNDYAEKSKIKKYSYIYNYLHTNKNREFTIKCDMKTFMEFVSNDIKKHKNYLTRLCSSKEDKWELMDNEYMEDILPYFTCFKKNLNEIILKLS